MKKLWCLLLVLATLGLNAQNAEVRQQMRQSVPVRNTRDISPYDIQFWVGQGSNELVVSFFACGPSPAGGWAYGYRFNGTATIQEMLDDLQDADPNFNINFSGSLIDDYSYSNGILNYSVGGGMLTYTINGTWASGLSDELHNGDQFVMSEWGDCDIPNLNVFYPVDPNVPIASEDASIDANDIVYWVGNGSNSAILAVNWCNPSTAFAWGVHFDGDSALVSDLMRTIVIYDNRFQYTSNGTMMSDITFQDGTYNLSLQGSWWMYNINGVGAMNGFQDQYVHNGDLIKWGDESCGIADDLFNYAWETPILPVSLPAPSTVTFDGIVGTEGCQAINCDNPAILGWASGCTVNRGYQDIANPITLTSFGTETAATGPATAVSTDAVSLGDGGSATLTFSQPISNGPGYDFAVFENSLNDVFLELAFVEVSSDGIHFYRFPSVSNTPIDQQISNAGTVEAYQTHNLAGKHRGGWGTPFDLAELEGYSNLDINHITHIRIVDVVGSVDPQYGTIDKNGHIINDPYPTDFASCGFDLTGVAILNGWTPNAVNDYTMQREVCVWPNPCQNQCTISSEQKEILQIEIYDLCGKLIYVSSAASNTYQINTADWKSGLYTVKIQFVDGSLEMQKIVKR